MKRGCEYVRRRCGEKSRVVLRLESGLAIIYLESSRYTEAQQIFQRLLEGLCEGHGGVTERELKVLALVAIWNFRAREFKDAGSIAELMVARNQELGRDTEMQFAEFLREDLYKMEDVSELT
jgi:hypothetical protein